MDKKKIYSENVASMVSEYAEKKSKFDKIKDKFTDIKSKFEEFMLEYFLLFPPKSDNTINVETNNKQYSITKVEKQTISWNANMLKKVLPNKYLDKIIKKHYTIINIDGMIKLMKKYNVPITDFNKYISIEESVDEHKLDNLYELGEISMKDVDGCYIVRMQKPYFIIK